MLLLQALDQMIGALAARFEGLGWDCPAVAFSLMMDVHDDSVLYRAEPIVVLEGHPAVALLRQHPMAEPEAIGAAVVVEAWGYSAAVRARLAAGEAVGFSPSEDPDRVEMRMVTVCLRDGTELSAACVRDGEVERLDTAQGWIPFALRRVAGAPSRAVAPRADLALRLAALWQLGNLAVLADQGVALPAAVTPTELARLSLPGLGPAPDEVQEAWWPAVAAALDGAPLELEALAGGVRRALDEQGWTLPVSGVPFVRGADEVLADAEMVAWMDDALLVAYMDATVPVGEDLVVAMHEVLGPAWGAALAERLGVPSTG